MVALLGPWALAVGLFAGVASILLWGRYATGGDTLRAARYTVVIMLAAAACAVADLEWALLTHDFSVAFVADNGSRATPLYYTITSLWASHDGSLMLWLLILTVFVAVVGIRPPRVGGGLHPWAMAVLSVVTAFFFGLSLFTSHAFDTVVPAPMDGPGPNPLLSTHPAMGIHPPLLYTGYVGLAVPFAFATAGLITGDVRSAWLRVVRRYTLVAWTALTAGIVVGAWWSYAVLGWGGYWAWDPVENASLMPWLVATALLHASMVQRRRGALPAWNVTLAVSAFLLACLGSFLTRSGAVVSVHAFARSAVGPVLLGFLVAVAAAVVALVLVRADRLSAPVSAGPLLSRSGALLVNNLLLGCLTVVVLLGTLFPLFTEAVSGNQFTVGPPYYNRMAVPIALALLVLMAVGPLMRWQRDQPQRLLRLLAAPVLVGAIVVVVSAVTGVRSGAALASFGLAAMVATSIAVECAHGIRTTHAVGGHWPTALRRWAMGRGHRNSGLVVHLGVVVAIVGIAASSAYTTSVQKHLHIGDRVGIGGVTASLDHLSRAKTGRAMTTSARLTLAGGGRDGTVIDAALSYFPAQGMTIAKPAVSSRITGDIYLTVMSVNSTSSTATIRLAHNPMVGWIWTGGGLMVIGGLLALWPRRRSGGGAGGGVSRPLELSAAGPLAQTEPVGPPMAQPPVGQAEPVGRVDAGTP